MARAMWVASLRLGEDELPVKLYAAVQEQSVHFRLLHATDHVPVAQRMIDPESGREVDREQMQRALEIEKGVFVVLTPEELAGAEPERSRTIEITRFVPREAVDATWYRRPYLLGPNGREADYFALPGRSTTADGEGLHAG
jgi:DNA end-binding protein Ku